MSPSSRESALPTRTRSFASFAIATARAVAASLAIAVTASAGSGRPATGVSAADRPNVLFIAVDDMRAELGSYGSEVRTPHLDALARRGVRFDRAYSQYPLCHPSRSSMLTGRYPLRTGVLDQHTPLAERHPDWTTLPRLFRENGYFTASAGKIFHAGFDDATAWEEGGERGPREARPGRRVARAIGREELVDRIVTLPDEGARHEDLDAVEDAIRFLRRSHDRPFFLALGVRKPHAPPSAPRTLLAAYPPEKVPLPLDFRSTPAASPGFPACSITPNIALFREREASEEEARRMKAAYWASMTWTDTNVGRVLAELDAQGWADRTVVVFWSDHGYHLGERGKWGKGGSLYEDCARVPLLVAAPGAARNGGVVAEPVQSVDLYPTLCELCGLDVPEGLDGVSLVPLLRDPSRRWDRPAFTMESDEDLLAIAVRTGRYRYAEWNGGEAGAMLIDEVADPAETTNLVDEPTMAALRESLARLAREHAAIGR